MRFGRLPADPVKVAAVPSLMAHPFAASPPPPVVDRSHIDLEPGLYRNDAMPDCTAAGLANSIRQVASLNGWEPVIREDRVLEFYAACAGVSPTPAAIAASHGAQLVDVLARQARTGFDGGGQTPFVGLYGRLSNERSALARAVAGLGHAYVGVTLHERDLEMAAIWDVQDGRDDGAVANGHALTLWDYTGLADGGLVSLGTWGAWQPATWGWIEARLDESYALVWRQLAHSDGTNMGVDADVLAADLSRMTTG